MVQPILLWQFQSFFIVSKSISKRMNSQPLLLLLPRREEKGEGLTVYVGPIYIKKFVLLRERMCCPLYKKKKFISAYHYFTCELSAIIPCSEGISCIVKKDFTCYRTKPPQKKGVASSKTWFITYKKSECYRLNRRRRPSCVKKGVFCQQEGHVLERRKASSCLILGLSTNREENDY